MRIDWWLRDYIDMVVDGWATTSTHWMQKCLF